MLTFASGDARSQYVLKADTFFVEYLDTKMVVVELNRSKGWDFETVGMARIPLQQVLDDFRLGIGVGRNRQYHYTDIIGPGGRYLGRRGPPSSSTPSVLPRPVVTMGNACFFQLLTSPASRLRWAAGILKPIDKVLREYRQATDAKRVGGMYFAMNRIVACCPVARGSAGIKF